jgi:hypothetical protein
MIACKLLKMEPPEGIEPPTRSLQTCGTKVESATYLDKG